MMKASLRGTIIGEEAWGHNYAEEVIRIVTREAKPKLEKTFTRVVLLSSSKRSSSSPESKSSLPLKSIS